MLLGLPIVGTLIETWMTRFRHRDRYFIYLLCYLGSLVGGFLGWIVFRTTGLPLGASGIVSAGTVLAIWYYWRFHWQGLSSLAPIGIGLVSMYLVAPPIIILSGGGIPGSAILHYYARVSGIFSSFRSYSYLIV